MTSLSVARRLVAPYQVATNTSRYVWGYREFDAFTGNTADWSNALVRETQRVAIDGRALRRPPGFNWIQRWKRVPGSNEALRAIRSGAYALSLTFGANGEQNVTFEQRPAAEPQISSGLRLNLHTVDTLAGIAVTQMWEGPHLEAIRAVSTPVEADCSVVNEHLTALYGALQTELAEGSTTLRIHVAALAVRTA